MEKKRWRPSALFFCRGPRARFALLNVVHRGATVVIHASPKSRRARGTPTSSLRRASQEAAQCVALPLATPRHGTRHQEQPARHRVVRRRGTVRGSDERGQKAYDRREHSDDEAGAVRSTPRAHVVSR